MTNFRIQLSAFAICSILALTSASSASAAHGDYNGDGTSDILWRNSSLGYNSIHLINNAVLNSKVSVSTVSNLDWKIAGTGDFNGDGTTDILWRNSVTGHNTIHLISNAALSSKVNVSTINNFDWKIAGTGDFNGDLTSDILWRNSVTGHNTIHLISNAALSSKVHVSTVKNLDWVIYHEANDIAGTNAGTFADAHLKWRVELPGNFSLVRPAVGPDGSVYAVDVDQNLVAVAPNGALRWTAANAGKKGVAVGPDGTVYTGNESTIKAFTPNGGLKWTYTQSPSAQVFHDIEVGPDGHVYVLNSSGMGVFSLDDTASGPVLRWSNPEPYVRLYVDYTDLAFGPTSNGQDQQLYFNVNGHVRGIRLSDGASVFTASGLSQIQRPQVSPADGTWHFGDAAFTPNGNNVWTFDFGTAATGIQPALGQSGIHYTISQGQILYAINPGGTGRFSTPLDESVGIPNVAPAETMLLLPTSSSRSHASGLKVVRTSNGSDLWRIEFPPDANGNRQHVDSPVAFSADGSTGYVMTTAASGSFPNTTYLNAIDLNPTIPSASSRLRSTNIEMSRQIKGQSSVTATGVVTVLDENRNGVSGVTVSGTWTLPDNSTVNVSATTNNSGDATLEVTGALGLFYYLTVTDMARADYTFEPNYSVLEGSVQGF